MKSIEELRAYAEKKCTPCDIITAIIYKTDLHEIPKKKSFFQRTFFQLKENHPDLFKDFIFDESPTLPFSDELDVAISRLETSQILSTLNPSYDKYTLTNHSDYFEDSYKKFKGKTHNEIDACAKLFNKCVTECVTE